MNRWILAFLFLGYVSIGNALECYVCTKQEDNDGKCLKSITTCEQGEDVCMTEVRWGSAPFWTSGGKKQYYISKKCVSKNECDITKRASMKHCTMLWYQDWKCYDCCVGDRCNSYIISTGHKQGTSLALLLVIMIAPLLGVWAIQ